MSTLTLLASAARTSSGTSALTQDLSRVRGAHFLLNVTAAATGAGDKLNVYIQSSIDDGTTYDDFVHFTEHLGNSGAKKYLAYWNRDTAAESELHEAQDAAIAAGVLQGPVGPTWRIKWVVTDAGGGVQSFTFSISARLIYDR